MFRQRILRLTGLARQNFYDAHLAWGRLRLASGGRCHDHRLVGYEHLARDRGFRRRDLLFTKNQPMAAKPQAVGILKLPPVDFLFVDEAPIRAPEVLEKQHFLNLDDAGMVRGDRGILQAEVIVMLSSDREGDASNLTFRRAAMGRPHEESGWCGVVLRHGHSFK
jgi:hypothetical protein